MSHGRDVLRVHGDAYSGEGLLDFAVNVWPGSHPVSLRRALERALRSGYPDERAAIAAIARRHRRSPDEVLLLNGASEGFWLLAHALRPATAVCIHPSFTEPEAALLAIGTAVTRIQRRQPDFALDPAAVPDDIDVVVTGNPNNPTGNLDDASAILQLARPGRLVVVDESFIEFVPGERESLADRTDLPGIVVVRSLTKLWSLAGVRAGYLLAAPAIIERLRGHRQPWSVNAPACAALELCMTDRRSRRHVSSAVTDARVKLMEALADIAEVTVWPSEANFLLLHVPHGPETAERLRRAGIAVRPAHTFPGLGPDHIRIAVRHDVENGRLVRALAKAINGDPTG